MTTETSVASNPFVLLMDPQAVFQALERSDRLQRLHSRVCRPLDKPLIPRVDAEDENDNELHAFDRGVDDAGDIDEEA